MLRKYWGEVVYFISFIFVIGTIPVGGSFSPPPSLNGSPPYEVQSISAQSGIYFESLGNVKKYNSFWKLVTFVNISILNDKYETAFNYHKKTGELCSALSSKYGDSETSILNTCQQFKVLGVPLLDELNQHRSSMLQYLGHHERKKRGLLNFVGDISKVLFGTCSDEDSQYFYSNIKKLTKTKEKELVLLKEQTKIVSSVIQHVNSTISAIDGMEKNMEDKITNLEAYAKHAEQTENSLKIREMLVEHMVILNSYLTQLSFEVQLLVSVVNAAMHGRLHTSVIPPKQLVSEIEDILKDLPEGYSFPFQTHSIDPSEVFESVENSIVYKGNVLMFIISIPMVDREFQLYKPIPLPVLKEAGYLMIEPTVDYVVISKARDYYISLSEHDLSKCRKLRGSRLCRYEKPLNKVSEKKSSICEVALFNSPETMPKNCNVKYSSTELDTWHRLSQSNIWLFAVNPDKIVIHCDSSHEPKYVTINGTGKLTLNEDCTAHTKYFVLIPSKQITSSVDTDFIPNTPLLSIKFPKLESKNKFNTSLFLQELTSSHIKAQNDLHDLAQDSVSLKEVDTKITDLRDSNDYTLVLENNFKHLSYTVIFSCIALTGLALVICYRSKKTDKGETIQMNFSSADIPKPIV